MFCFERFLVSTNKIVYWYSVEEANIIRGVHLGAYKRLLSWTRPLFSLRWIAAASLTKPGKTNKIKKTKMKKLNKLNEKACQNKTMMAKHKLLQTAK